MKTVQKKKRGWFTDCYDKKLKCTVENNIIFATNFVSGKVICPSCGNYGFRRVYLHHSKGIITPSLKKYKRCLTVKCWQCQMVFNATVECHPDCKNRIDCLTHSVQIDLSRWIKEEPGDSDSTTN